MLKIRVWRNWHWHGLLVKSKPLRCEKRTCRRSSLVEFGFEFTISREIGLEKHWTESFGSAPSFHLWFHRSLFISRFKRFLALLFNLTMASSSNVPLTTATSVKLEPVDENKIVHIKAFKKGEPINLYLSEDVTLKELKETLNKNVLTEPVGNSFRARFNWNEGWKTDLRKAWDKKRKQVRHYPKTLFCRSIHSLSLSHWSWWWWNMMMLMM